MHSEKKKDHWIVAFVKKLIILCYRIIHLEKFNVVARPKSPLQPQPFQGSLNYGRKR